MSRKTKDIIIRTKGKDNTRKTFHRYGKYSMKHVRHIEKVFEIRKGKKHV